MSLASQEMEDELLSRLEQGELITQICRDPGIPDINLVQKWRREDSEFDEKCWSAEGRGLMVQRAHLIEKMHRAIEEGGAGASARIQGYHNLLHDNARAASKLVARMNDRSELRMSGKVEGTPFVVGWASDFQTPCPKCGYEHVTS